MGNYGYLHLGRVLSYDETRNAYSLESVGLARTSKWPATPSCVPGLQPGDRVILAAKGSSRDDLVIIGKVGAAFPDITDIDGLIAALAAKADSADVLALTDALGGRLDTAETSLVTLDGRLDAAEAAQVTFEGRLDGVDTTLDALTARLYKVELNPFRASRDLFTDALSTMDREDVVNAITLTNGTIYVTRLYGLPAITVSAIRMVTAVAGTVGTGNIALYAGSATSALTQVRTGTIALTTLGRVTHTLSSAYAAAAETQFAVALLPLTYSTPPQIGGRSGIVHSSMINPSTALATSVTKAGQTVLPASIDLTDGSWTTGVTSKMWIALG